jgi:Domain of unknown function (DUF1877)
MSMNVLFVQVEDAEIARFEADPDSVKARFVNQTLPTTGLLNVTAAMQKAWHGLHYLLAGAAEPGTELRSQAVLGGVEIGRRSGGLRRLRPGALLSRGSKCAS